MVFTISKKTANSFSADLNSNWEQTYFLRFAPHNNGAWGKCPGCPLDPALGIRGSLLVYDVCGLCSFGRGEYSDVRRWTMDNGESYWK